MARGNERTTSRRSPKDAARRTKKKPCALCRDKIDWVDYKDVPMLRKYMSDRGKIRARRVTGNCAQHQREIALAIKTARELVLLPYTQRTVTERTGGRGRGRGDRGDRGGGGGGGGFRHDRPSPTPSTPPPSGEQANGGAPAAAPSGDGAPAAVSETPGGGTAPGGGAAPESTEPATVGAAPESDA
jgi:small subunit ribosomal protein S18